MKELKVEQVMTHLVVALRREDSLHEAAAVLSRNHVSGAPVIDDGKVVGVISEDDILRALWPRKPGETRTSMLSLLFQRDTIPSAVRTPPRVGGAMSTPPIAVQPTLSVYEAAALMHRKKVKRLPVVDQEADLLGIVSRADLVRVMARSDEAVFPAPRQAEEMECRAVDRREVL